MEEAQGKVQAWGHKAAMPRPGMPPSQYLHTNLRVTNLESL